MLIEIDMDKYAMIVLVVVKLIDSNIAGMNDYYIWMLNRLTKNSIRLID